MCIRDSFIFSYLVVTFSLSGSDHFNLPLHVFHLITFFRHPVPFPNQQGGMHPQIFRPRFEHQQMPRQNFQNQRFPTHQGPQVVSSLPQGAVLVQNPHEVSIGKISR